MKEELSLNVSSVFNVAKVLSILSVILAHSRINDSSIFSTIAEMFGAIGVVTFFFISGYFFNVSKYGVNAFFKKKIKSIIIPWLFLGTLVYIIGNKFSFLSWIYWIVGNGTYLYYLSVLMACYVISSFFFKKWHRYFFIVLNIISLILTSFGLIDEIWIKVFGFSSFNNYLNVFNWIGFFTLGILFKGKIEFWLYKLKNNIIIILSSYVLIIFISLSLDSFNVVGGGYFSKLAIPLELIGILVVFSLSTLTVFHNQIIYRISDFTFSIYLIHFLVFPFRRFLISGYFFQFINPVFYLLLRSGIILIGIQIAKKIKLENLFNVLMGLR
jgi:fucose 4-O-acetylase-like acetyltransferase